MSIYKVIIIIIKKTMWCVTMSSQLVRKCKNVQIVFDYYWDTFKNLKAFRTKQCLPQFYFPNCMLH